MKYILPRIFEHENNFSEYKTGIRQSAPVRHHFAVRCSFCYPNPQPEHVFKALGAIFESSKNSCLFGSFIIAVIGVLPYSDIYLLTVQAAGAEAYTFNGEKALYPFMGKAGGVFWPQCPNVHYNYGNNGICRILSCKHQAGL